MHYVVHLKLKVLDQLYLNKNVYCKPHKAMKKLKRGCKNGIIRNI